VGNMRTSLNCRVRDQEGLANVCLVGRAVTLVRAKVEANLPRKRGAAAAGYEKAINRFYEKVWPPTLGTWSACL